MKFWIRQISLCLSCIVFVWIFSMDFLARFGIGRTTNQSFPDFHTVQPGWVLSILNEFKFNPACQKNHHPFMVFDPKINDCGWPSTRLALSSSSSSSSSPPQSNKSLKTEKKLVDRLSTVIDAVNDYKLPPEFHGSFVWLLRKWMLKGISDL